MQKLLTVGQVARRLRLSEDTVRSLADTGALKARRTAGGHRRFTEDTVERYEARPPTSARRKKTAPPKRRSVRVIAAPIFDDSTDEDEEMFDDMEDFPEDKVPVASAPPVRVVARAPAPAESIWEDTSERARQAAAEVTRLQALKAYGATSIPYDVPVAVRSKIVEELEAYVTTERLPAWVSTWEQHTLVKGRVDAIVEAHRQRVREDAEQSKAEEARRAAAAQASRAAQEAAATATAEAARRVQELIDHGKRYAEDGLREFRGLDRWEIRSEIEKALQEEVEADWSERNVEDLVDDLLGEFDDDSEGVA